VGIIDSATITLSCPQCGLTESSRIVDKGSGWSGSSWQRPSFDRFEVTVTGGDEDEPKVVGVCTQCKVAAEVSKRYAT